MIILEENFKRHLEAFASKLFIFSTCAFSSYCCCYGYFKWSFLWHNIIWGTMDFIFSKIQFSNMFKI